MSLSTACSASRGPLVRSRSSDCWRRLSSPRSRIGRFSQRRSNRLPMAVAQRSIKPASVYSTRAPRLVSISRLRRVWASRITACSRRSRCSVRRCGSAARCVSFAYCSRHPAAPIAAGASSASKPERSRVPSCSQSSRLLVPGSKCHGGRRRTPAAPSSHAGTSTPSGSSSSAGFKRSSSACNASRSASSVRLNRPPARSSQASPIAGASTTAASSRVSLSSSSAASVSVPGVMTRTTSRATGPLLVAGSPICSQIATDSPSRTSLAR